MNNILIFSLLALTLSTPASAGGFPILWEREFGDFSGNAPIAKPIKLSGKLRCNGQAVRRAVSKNGFLHFQMTEYLEPHATILKLEQIPYPTVPSARVMFSVVVKNSNHPVEFAADIKGISYTAKSNPVQTRTLFSGDDLSNLAHVAGRVSLAYISGTLFNLNGTIYIKSRDKSCTFNGTFIRRIIQRGITKRGIPND